MIWDRMKITIVYDNEIFKAGLKSGWGFSCLIDKDILFDTGDDGVALLYNMKRLGINPSDIKILVLSHGHWDHIGGLSELLMENPDISIYALKSFSRELKDRILEITRLIEIEGPMCIRKDIHTTGSLGTFIKEQSLICLDRKGAFVITGCSHSGLDKIIDTASKSDKVYGVIGGFHGFNKLNVLKDLKLICPCHCTQHKEEIARKFPKQHIKCGAGLVIE